MIVEVFKKGTNFQEHIDTYWNVLKIDNQWDSCKLILIYDGQHNVVLDAEQYELRVTA